MYPGGILIRCPKLSQLAPFYLEERLYSELPLGLSGRAQPSHEWNRFWPFVSRISFFLSLPNAHRCQNCQPLYCHSWTRPREKLKLSLFGWKVTPNHEGAPTASCSSFIFIRVMSHLTHLTVAFKSRCFLASLDLCTLKTIYFGWKLQSGIQRYLHRLHGSKFCLNATSAPDLFWPWVVFFVFCFLY